MINNFCFCFSTVEIQVNQPTIKTGSSHGILTLLKKSRLYISVSILHSAMYKLYTSEYRVDKIA